MGLDGQQIAALYNELKAAEQKWPRKYARCVPARVIWTRFCSSGGLLHASQITDWKRQLLEHAVDIVAGGAAPQPVDLAPLHAKMGRQALELDFFADALTQAGWLSATP